MRISSIDRFLSEVIIEYIGKEYLFLKNFMNSDYRNYVLINKDKIIYKNIFGRKIIIQEYKGLNDRQVMDKIFLNCEITIDYIKEQVKFILDEYYYESINYDKKSKFYSIVESLINDRRSLFIYSEISIEKKKNILRSLGYSTDMLYEQL